MWAEAGEGRHLEWICTEAFQVIQDTLLARWDVSLSETKEIVPRDPESGKPFRRSGRLGAQGVEQKVGGGVGEGGWDLGR